MLGNFRAADGIGIIDVSAQLGEGETVGRMSDSG